jgi:hypothetical protein
MEKNNDFTVWMNERYNMTKEEFEHRMIWADTVEEEFKNLGLELPAELKSKVVKYEEESCMDRMPQVDYDKLFVGARLYADPSESLLSACHWDEIEITHIYGGVVFYKFLEGEREGEETWSPKGSFGFMRLIYPKVVMKPACIEVVCDCPKTIFKNW